MSWNLLGATSPQHEVTSGSGPPSPSLLHPHSYSPGLRPPTRYSMSDESSHDDDFPSQAPSGAGPFNFQTQFISTTPVKSNIGQRRGHRYKHSSISTQHQIFLEPPPRPPPVLPASLPIPTPREAWSSMTTPQRARLLWCFCHALVALYVFFSASGSLAMTALSHLVFFDVGSAAICVVVEVLGNFEVWKRSSVRHPFGLQRVEVLAGFAMSVFLVFGGFDLISHNLKHMLEGMGGHKPHHPHSHRRVEMGTVDFASLAAVVSTLISAYGLKNHGRIRRVMRVPLPFSSTIGKGLGVLGNPFLFLTLTFSFLLLLLPLLSVTYFTWLDRVICAAIAVSMFVLGTRLAVAQGLMLLMSYSGRSSSTSTSTSSSLHSHLNSKKSDLPTIPEIPRGTNNSTVSSVVREIEMESSIARVDEAQFWQVHYGLAMANLKVCLVRGIDDGTLSKLRNRIAKTVNNRLGEGYGHGASLRWEVTVQTSTDK